MALCCLLPLALLALWPFTGWNSGGLLSVGIVLICPLGMILAMFAGRNCHSGSGRPSSDFPTQRATRTGNPRMRAFLFALVAAVLPFSLSSAQEPPAQTPSPVAVSTPSAASSSQMSDMQAMNEMAKMCTTMMAQEKAAMPYIIGTGITFGVLLFVALLLLVILEVQWIVYWSRVLKKQREHPNS